LDESIKIVNTIKTKAIQAAQDGQTTESRKAIQSDVNKLMEELDMIAKTTSFNNQKLLSGNFTNKKFQVGAYSGETVNISIGSSESTKIGHVSTSTMTFADSGTAALSIYSNLQNETYTLNTVEVAYDNTSENSLGAVADAINKLSDILGITADANVSSTTDNHIVAGTTDSTFAINGVTIGELTVQENDSDGALAASINQKTDQHGVYASVDQAGKLTLTSTDNRAIEVTQDTATTAVLGGTTDMSTLGEVVLTQHGTSEIVVNNRAGGMAVALADDSLETSGVISTTIDSSLASGSTIIAGSTIGGGSTLATGINEAIDGAVYTTGSSTLGSGSVLEAASIINSGTTLTSSVVSNGAITGTGTLGSGSTLIIASTIGGGTTTHFNAVEAIDGAVATTGTSTLTTGSILEAGSELDVGSTILTADYVQTDWDGGNDAWDVSADGLTMTATASNVVDAGETVTATNGSISMATSSSLADGSTLGVGSTVSDDFVLASEATTDADMTLAAGTNLITLSTLAEGTNLVDDTIVLNASTTLGADMTLSAGSTLATASTLATGTTLSDDWKNASDISVAGGDMDLAAGSSLATGAIFAEGSSIGGTVTLANAEVVDSSTDMLVAGGSSLADGTVITAGTMLTNDVVADDGTTYTAGTQLTGDITTSGATALTNDMTLNGGSILAAGSSLAANSSGADGSAVASTSSPESYRLSDIDLTSQEGAQIAISVADSALKSLDKVRSDLGSVQNQLTATISNVSVTRVNIFAAESSIRDVDFAEEAANFSKMQILVQASSFAMAQANASSQSVLSLLQG
ncbi:MAG: flagellin, partial [Thermodesulfobacteriota bacterium]|nr:flagellin [Thermodesulfobacteriota bacterium]